MDRIKNEYIRGTTHVVCFQINQINQRGGSWMIIAENMRVVGVIEDTEESQIICRGDPTWEQSKDKEDAFNLH